MLSTGKFVGDHYPLSLSSSIKSRLILFVFVCVALSFIYLVLQVS